MNLVEELSGSPVLIATGTGGVGKTTLSCAIAISLAQQNNARVLVVTIDPAQRLATVLSEDHLEHRPCRIDHSRFLHGDTERGEVFAAMVDAQTGWKEIVERYAKSDTDAQRIFDNKLYKNLTTRFSHSHDFVAMDQLLQHYRSGKFDFIVLDTPPTSQAFGFFDAPQAMAEFFGGRLVRLVTSPYRLGRGRAAKLFDLASQPFFALADKVLGKQFLNDIGEFFFLFQTMYDDFAARAESITEFISSKRVHAALITNPSQFISDQHGEILDGLVERKIDVDHVIVNNVPFSFKHVDELDELLPQISHEDGEIALEDVIAEFIRRDRDVTLAVHSALSHRDVHNPLRGTTEVPVALVTRTFAEGELARMADLVDSVQNNSDLDDTI